MTQHVEALVALRYPLDRVPDEWEIPEVPVPESVAHDQLVAYLVALLAAWAARGEHDVLIARNLAVRWVMDRPAVGIDPDVAVIDPRPPNAEQLTSLRLWEPGCVAPRLAIEVVSRSHPYKDYAVLPERYAAMGASELWVLDPGRFGPRRLGGPQLIQQWIREADGTFVRRHAGEGPVYSESLCAWVHADTSCGVVVSSDAAAEERWLTPAELERRRAQRLEAKLRALGVDPDE